MGTILHPDDPFHLPLPLPVAAPLATRVIGEGGPTVILIHVLGRVAAIWADVARLTIGRLRLVLMDNPGIGRSSNLRVPSTIQGHAAAYEETLRSLNLPGPFHVAGLSLGGMIAPALASRLGSSAASVTLLSSSSLESGFCRLSPTSLLRMAGRSIRTLGIDHRVNMAELVSPRLLDLHPHLWRQLDEIQQAEGFSAIAGTRQLIAAARFRIKPLVASLPARRFVAVGDHDRLVPPGNSQRLAEILGVPLEVLPGRHHDLSIDAPEAVAELLFRITGA